ncbi:hypothetical protein GCM10025759_14570 [Lysobacter panacisoli]|uniref:Uncharacterized protein n=1 Tax=Lysobacter panacisoli TaxID=1255263 RepID=A0ABP9L916_9GAMM
MRRIVDIRVLPWGWGVDPALPSTPAPANNGHVRARPLHIPLRADPDTARRCPTQCASSQGSFRVLQSQMSSSVAAVVPPRPVRFAGILAEPLSTDTMRQHRSSPRLACESETDAFDDLPYRRWLQWSGNL